MTNKISWLHNGKALTGNVVEEDATHYVVIVTAYEVKKHKGLVGKKFLVKK